MECVYDPALGAGSREGQISRALRTVGQSVRDHVVPPTTWRVTEEDGFCPLQVCKYTHTCARTHTHAYTHACTCAHSTCICACAHTQASVHIPHTSVHTHAHTLGTLAFHYKLIRENPHLQLSYDKKLDVHALKMSNSRMIPRIFISCVRLFACVPHVPLPVITVLKPKTKRDSRRWLYRMGTGWGQT